MGMPDEGLDRRLLLIAVAAPPPTDGSGDDGASSAGAHEEDGPAPRLPRATLHPSGRQFPVAFGRSLLEAALDAGWRLPRSCRNGTCRACRCRLLEGAVRYRIEWPGLLAEEKAEGWILPCVAVIDADVIIEADALAEAPRHPG